MHVGYKEENAKELLSVLLANKTLNESYSDPASL